MKLIIQETLFKQHPGESSFDKSHDECLHPAADGRTAPSGWYPDADNKNFICYWNGSSWTKEKRLRKRWMQKP